MKIKKVSQSVGVTGNIANTKTESNRDTYSCNYLNDNSVVISPTEPDCGNVWIEKSRNLYNKEKYPLTFNKALDPSTGNTYSTSAGNYYATEVYIPIDGSVIKSITFSSIVTISFYKSDKKFISGSGDKQTYDVPENTAFIRFDIHKNNIENIQIEEGKVAHEFQPFVNEKINIKDADIFKNLINISSLKEDLNFLKDVAYSFKTFYYSADTAAAEPNAFVSGLHVLDTNANVSSNRPKKVNNQLEIVLVFTGNPNGSGDNGVQIWFNGWNVVYFRIKHWGTYSSWAQLKVE